MEYYGISDQIFYEVYISSNTMFRDFEFDAYIFCYVCSKCNEGIETAKYSGGVRITDKERAVVDSIKGLDKIPQPRINPAFQSKVCKADGNVNPET